MHLITRYVTYRAMLFTRASCLRGLQLLFAIALLQSAARAQVVELISNGGFESGGVGWSVLSSHTTGTGGWNLSIAGTPTWLAGLPTDGTGGDNLYAVSDQLSVGTAALLHSFTVPTDHPLYHLLLSFDMFVNDWALVPTFNANQHSRVDIITGAAASSDPLNTTTAVVYSAYLGTDGGPLPNRFQHFEFDVAGFLTPGQTYAVRFQTTVSLSQINQGVDNLSVRAVPEPSTLALAITALASAVVTRRKRGRFTR
jgi:hypothetical protein